MERGTSRGGESVRRPGARSATVQAIVAIALMGGLLGACIGRSGTRLRYDHEYALSPGRGHAPHLATALLMPIDATNDARVEALDVSNEKLAALIVEYLGSKGIRVERADPRGFDVASDAALRELLAEKRSADPGAGPTRVSLTEGIPRILEKLDRDPSLVIVADVVQRGGRWTGGNTLVWDGIRRRDRTAGHGTTTGTSAAASLFVAIHERDGTRVFWGYGGLDLVYAFNLKEGTVEIRRDRLQQEKNLAKGVCVAFYPYFGAKESCYR